MVLPGVAVEVVSWVGEGVTGTVGVLAGGSVPVAATVADVVPVGSAVSVVAAVAGMVAVVVGSAATPEGVAVGWDVAWAHAISSNVANAARKNQRAMPPPTRRFVHIPYDRLRHVGLVPPEGGAAMPL